MQSLIDSFVGIIIAYFVVMIWLTVKAIELVVRVLMKHPTNRLLWAALAAFAFFYSLVVLTEGHYRLINSLASLSLAFLLIVAKAIEIYYDKLLQPQISKNSLLDSALHQPWWNVQKP